MFLLIAINKDFPMSSTTKGITWAKCRDFASIICSRESTYRTMLDITAWDLPIFISDLFRGWKKAIESAIEGFGGTITIVLSPVITSIVGKTLGKEILPKHMQQDTIQYLKFTAEELRSNEGILKGIKRLSEEEPEDKRFIASLMKRVDKTKQVEKYEKEALEVEEFSKNVKISDEERSQIYKLKKATIIGESLIEGLWWGGFGLLIRSVRKYILQEDRFTGTKGYVSDSESESLGEAGNMNLFQKICGAGSMFVSPITNSILFHKIDNTPKNKSGKFLNHMRENFDMTHGVYPKLELLFSMTAFPKWCGLLTTTQGWYEFSERIMKAVTLVPSWWLGHRVTNGLFALNADKNLAKKYNVDKGVLVEKEYLEPITKNDNFLQKLAKRFPEPAKIHHVLKSTAHNPELQKEAENEHAKALYKGFALHSLAVCLINMGVNQVTKIRALHALEK